MTMLGAPSQETSIIYPHYKGFPPSAYGKTVPELAGRLALGDGFTTPVLLLSDSCLRANLLAMEKFCRSAGLSLAPHVKTSMSPEIISLQFEHGAWAATVATFTQAATVRSPGVDRILIANEYLDPAGIEWLGSETDRDEHFTGFCFVDSAACVAMLDSALSARGQQRPLPVLVEYGVTGGRTGVRTLDDAMKLAALVEDSDHLQLAGVAGFEGIIDTGGPSGRFDDVIHYLRDLRRLADEVYREFGAHLAEFIVTVGGSSFIELVRDEFGPEWRADRPIRVVLRSGCYVVHDSGVYAKFRAAMADRALPLELGPALELWARVLSRPERVLAILDFGKRDVGIDAGLPRPQHILRSGAGQVEPCPPSTLTAVNDQHAYLRMLPSTGNTDPERSVKVGDLMGFGISHPCTTFDKWRLIPIVDQDRTLIGAARTLF